MRKLLHRLQLCWKNLTMTKRRQIHVRWPVHFFLCDNDTLRTHISLQTTETRDLMKIDLGEYLMIVIEKREYKNEVGVSYMKKMTGARSFGETQ